MLLLGGFDLLNARNDKGRPLINRPRRSSWRDAARTLFAGLSSLDVGVHGLTGRRSIADSDPLVGDVEVGDEDEDVAASSLALATGAMCTVLPARLSQTPTVSVTRLAQSAPYTSCPCSIGGLGDRQ